MLKAFSVLWFAIPLFIKLLRFVKLEHVFEFSKQHNWACVRVTVNATLDKDNGLVTFENVSELSR